MSCYGNKSNILCKILKITIINGRPMKSYSYTTSNYGKGSKYSIITTTPPPPLTPELSSGGKR